MKRKAEGRPWVPRVTILAIAVLLGLVLGRMDLDVGFYVDPPMLLLQIAMLVLAMLLQVILHEAGHLAFGLLTGYRLVSFRVFSVALVRERDGLRVRRYRLARTGGQCLMAPPDGAYDAVPYALYNLGGILFNLLSAGISLLLLYRAAPFSLLRQFLFLLVITGVLNAAINGIPWRGSQNDMCNLLSARRSPAARYSLWLQLRLVAIFAGGERLRDVPEALFQLPAGADLSDMLTAYVPGAYCSYLEDVHDFDRARAETERVLAEVPGLSPIAQDDLQAALLFYELIGPCREEAILRLYEGPVARYLTESRNTILGIPRVRYAYALLFLHDGVEAREQREAFGRMAAGYPYAGIAKGEAELMALVDARYEARGGMAAVPFRKV